jgi:hypothetical protein
MKQSRSARVLWSAVVAVLGCAEVGLGQNLNLGPEPGSALNGPTGVRANLGRQLYNVSGAGVVLGQGEPGEPRRTHDALIGGMPAAANTAGNGLQNDEHATNVAGVMIGRSFTFNPGPGDITINGVATGGTLFSNGGPYFERLPWLVAAGRQARIINMSAGFGPSANNADPQTLFLEQFTRVNDVVYVKSAGNAGPGAGTITVPGHAYNSIVVGRTGGTAAGGESTDYTRLNTEAGTGSSQGPAGDAIKPDIVAPGTLIWMTGPQANSVGPLTNQGFNRDSGTSFAAPHVSGAAALLKEYADREGRAWDRFYAKAVLLNSASKHVRDPSDGDRAWPVWAAAQQTTEFPDGVPVTRTEQPLANGLGIGQLNVVAALRQYADAGRNDLARKGGFVGGNDFQNYNIDANPTGRPMHRGSLVTATLVWERMVTLDNAAAPAVAASYTASPLSNLNLELLNVTTGRTVAISRSGGLAATGGNNVEHVYANVPEDGEYRLVVRNRSAVRTEFALTFAAADSTGMTFTVDNGTRGQDPATTPGRAFPNDVNTLGQYGTGNFATGAELFSSNTRGTNQLRLSGGLQTRARVGPFNGPPAAMNVLDPAANRGVLGLRSGDQITGVTFGRDGTRGSPGGENVGDGVLLFSVAADSQGADNTAVRADATPNPGRRQASGIYKSNSFLPFGLYPSSRTTPATGLHQRHVLGTDIGLAAQTADRPQDNLRDFEMDRITDYVDIDGDGVHREPVFFTLKQDSPTITGSGGLLHPSDILLSRAQDNSFRFNPDSQLPFDAVEIFAGFASLGLQATDRINALVLSDIRPGGGLSPDGLLLPFVATGTPFDSALFTLAPGSPSLGMGYSTADVLFTAFDGRFSTYANWFELGLRQTDVIDGLDILTVPESGLLAGLGVPALLLIRVRRRR